MGVRIYTYVCVCVSVVPLSEWHFKREKQNAKLVESVTAGPSSVDTVAVQVDISTQSGSLPETLSGIQHEFISSQSQSNTWPEDSLLDTECQSTPVTSAEHTQAGANLNVVCI